MRLNRTNFMSYATTLRCIPAGDCFMCRTGEAIYIVIADRMTQFGAIGTVSLGSGKYYEWDPDKTVMPVDAEVNWCRT